MEAALGKGSLECTGSFEGGRGRPEGLALVARCRSSMLL
jgi:hypothetical protein